MANTFIYFEYQNTQRIVLPVNPEKLEVSAKGNNSTANVIGLGDVNLLKIPQLQTITFQTYIPSVISRLQVPAASILLPSANHYKEFFQKLQEKQEPIRFVVVGLYANVSLQMVVEGFDYWWSGGDPDMYIKLSLKQYRKSSIATVQLANQANANQKPQQQSAPRENTAKKVTIGSKVRVNGQLHRDSFGAGPGAVETNAIRLVNFVKKGRKCPYHVTTLTGGWRGWVTESSVEVIE